MIPVSLTLAGFLSYRDPATLDFTGFDIACIAGSNGAGKSSLLDAITYALFGKARKADETLINLHPDVKEARVEFVFDYETNRYRILRTIPRGKTTLLEFQIAQGRPLTADGLLSAVAWKPLTERSIRDTQARIEETLRLDYDTFVNASFFLQGKADQFTQQRPAARKKILGSILGLETWETYRQRAADARKAVEAEITALDGRLAEINAELSEEADRRLALQTLEDELTRLETVRAVQESALENMRKLQATLEEQQKMVDTLARQLAASRQRINELEFKEGARTRERETYAQSLARALQIQAAYRALQDTRTQLASWDQLALAFQEHQAHRAEPLAAIREEKARLETEQTALRAQQATVADGANQITNYQLQITLIQTSLAETETRLAEKSQLEQRHAAALEQQATAKAENPRLKDEMEALRGRIDQLEAAPGDAALCPLCGQPLTPEHRANLIEELTAEGTEKGGQYRENAAHLKDADALVRELQTGIAALQPLDQQARAQSAELEKLKAMLAQGEAEARAWEQTGQPRLAEIERLLDADAFAEEARATLAATDADLKALGYDAAEHDRVRRDVEVGAAVEEDVRTLEKAEAALEPLDRELADLKLQITNYQSEFAQQQELHDSAARALAASQADAPNVYQAQRDLMDMVEQENRLRGRLGAAQQMVSVLGSLRERRAAIELEREGHAQQVGQYKQLERAFGKDGVPALLIEQALPQIEAKANELLERLSGGEMSVRFLTQRELKTRDDLRETLDISISDPAGTRDYEMYSGGEAFRVNFAIRLALSEVLAQRAGARLQTLVIDEGFGSQDAAGRQRLIEAINMVKDDFAKILVITHIDELKDAFPTRIEVEKGVRGSEVRVV